MGDSYSGMMVGTAMSDVNVGPLISARQKEIVDGFLAQGDDLRLVAQGTIIDGTPEAGNYVVPTLFADVPPDHVLAQKRELAFMV